MRKQFITLMLLTFTAVSAAAQAPTLTIVTETAGLPSELFYGATKVKPVRLRPGTNTLITIDDSDFFAQQHYIDFLRRFPDAPGHAFWTSEITKCSDPANRNPGESEAQCVDRKRVNTSGAFFLSPEFQNTGSFLVRVNWGSLGQKRAAGQKCILGQHAALDAVCQPLYPTYVSDMTALTQGIVVNNALDPARINQNKQAFVTAFVQRAEFLAEYPNTMTAAQYVAKLEQTTGVALTQAERDALVAEAGGAGGRASVLFKMVDGTTTLANGELRFDTRYGQAFYNAQFNPVFVYMQYLGYLRRNPDQGGFDFWLGKLVQYGNFTDAEMVRSFIVAPEYRDRF